ncbi:MAG: deoxyribose-phosphate aldolase [Alphaproteobacteria bacterium]|nr:deoxyribose-phosphate aldolase [Alphaproteobacteria bacterium]
MSTSGFKSALDLARLIDHTLLKPTASQADIGILCREAIAHGFWSVCVAGTWVATAHMAVRGSPVKVCAVVGFPLGNASSTAKAAETAAAVKDGADEIDMVINLGALKAGDIDTVTSDIRNIVTVAAGRPVKTILETCFLTDGEKRIAAKAAVAAGAAFVKTSTGFGRGGATVADVTLLRQAVDAGTGVKASGGIRDLATATAMVAAGATRLGTSASVALMSELAGGRPKTADIKSY